jgi:hypothetical protein
VASQSMYWVPAPLLSFISTMPVPASWASACTQ